MLLKCHYKSDLEIFSEALQNVDSSRRIKHLLSIKNVFKLKFYIKIITNFNL